MSVSGPSSLSLVASGIYAVVVLACLIAALVAVWKRQISGHVITWIVFAVFFAVLVFLRLNNLEEIWRDELRDMMRADGSYENRRTFQGPIVVGLLIMAALAVFVWIVRGYRAALGRRDVAVAAAQLGVFMMLGLIAVRMVSFSLVDKLLYGPLKLNWVGDIGSAGLVAGCALYYASVVIAPPRRKKPR